MTKAMYNAKELSEVLGCSETKAYQYIKQMNEELQKAGFLVLRGKVSKAYVEKRFFGLSRPVLAADQEGEQHDRERADESSGKAFLHTAEPKSS